MIFLPPWKVYITTEHIANSLSEAFTLYTNYFQTKIHRDMINTLIIPHLLYVQMILSLEPWWTWGDNKNYKHCNMNTKIKEDRHDYIGN